MPIIDIPPRKRSRPKPKGYQPPPCPIIVEAKSPREIDREKRRAAQRKYGWTDNPDLKEKTD